MKKIITLFVAALFTTSSIFAASYSSIKVNKLQSGDNNYVLEDEAGSIYLYDETMGIQHIIGSVTSDCVSVRCIWSSTSIASIWDYILNGSKATKGIDDFTLSKYTAGSTSFTYNASESLDNMQWGSNYYVFIAKFKDGSYKHSTLTLYIHQGSGYERGKPVIYLYPQKKTTVSVKVSPKGGVTESIPEYKNGWKVSASPDGKLTDKKTGKEYPYLFWESNDFTGEVDTSEGFVVETAELEKFFVEKLTFLGLNEKEIADFNEFWIPEINKSEKPYTFITFNSMDRINSEAPLVISPKPDSIIRVYFEYLALDEAIETKEQTLTPAERSGFAVVEWGGKKTK